METSIGRVKTTLQALHLLDRFSRLNIKKLGIEEKYRQLFLQFGNDIEAVKIVRETREQYSILLKNRKLAKGVATTIYDSTSIGWSWDGRSTASIPVSKFTCSTNLSHHSLLAPTWTAFSDYTGPEFSAQQFSFLVIFFFFILGRAVD